MKKTLRIGSNRGKARIWIEGSALASNGWNKGDQFLAYFRAGHIVYERVITGTRGARKVAGTPSRPIIDTNTVKIRNSLGAATHAEIHIAERNIWINPATLT